MQNDQAQCISFNKLNISQIFHLGFLIKPTISTNGNSPKTENKISPGIKKSVKGEECKNEIGIFSSALSGDISNKAPP